MLKERIHTKDVHPPVMRLDRAVRPDLIGEKTALDGFM